MVNFRCIIPVFSRQCCFNSSSTSGEVVSKDASSGKLMSLNPVGSEPSTFIRSTRFNSSNIYSIGLEVIESTQFEQGESIELSSTGISSPRASTAETLSAYCTMTEATNGVKFEFKLPEEEAGFPHFAIAYDSRRSCFLLSDLGQVTTFMRIDEALPLKTVTRYHSAARWLECYSMKK